MGRPVTDMLGFESLNVPVVAAIHGYALGGGLEVRTIRESYPPSMA
jgi:enoyl-CoA hydratase/carnithine racemase